jgi:hypothetical protein
MELLHDCPLETTTSFRFFMDLSVRMLGRERVKRLGSGDNPDHKRWRVGFPEPSAIEGVVPLK